MITQENIPYTADEIKAMVKTIEELRKKYNGALERAKYALTTDMDNSGHWAVNYIFPELKESEDEKTRKAILTGLIDCRDAPDLGWSNFGGINIDECIAWLEKQKEPKDSGEISTSVNVRKKKATGVLGEMIANINPESLQKTKEQMAAEVEQQIKGCIGMILTDANERRFEDVGVTLKECLEWLEKQSEKTNPYSGMSFEYNGHIWGMCARDNGVDILLDKQLFEHLEKQDEQKPTDKIEPKFNFKVGQWIVATGKRVYLITKIDGFNVTLIDTNGDKYVVHISSLVDAHLWTIADAKDGDVLAFDWVEENGHVQKDGGIKWQKIVIFKSLNTAGVGGYGCTFRNNELAFDTGVPYYSKTWTVNLHPATKEQRDLLFQKMKDSGHEWDTEKKELKTIEQDNPVWSEEDEEMLTWLCRIIHSLKARKEITPIEESELGEWMDKWLNHNPQAKQGHMLDPDEVIAWLNHRELSRDDVVTTVIPDDSPTSVSHKVKWLSDKFIEQFKKDFGL